MPWEAGMPGSRLLQEALSTRSGGWFFAEDDPRRGIRNRSRLGDGDQDSYTWMVLGESYTKA